MLQCEHIYLSIYLSCEISSHNIYKSFSSQLLGTNQYWCRMRNHGCGHVGLKPTTFVLRCRHLNRFATTTLYAVEIIYKYLIIESVNATENQTRQSTYILNENLCKQYNDCFQFTSNGNREQYQIYKTQNIINIVSRVNICYLLTRHILQFTLTLLEPKVVSLCHQYRV